MSPFYLLNQNLIKNIQHILSFCHMPNILGQKGIIFFGQHFAIPTISAMGSNRF